ncbi:plasmalemma vesicle-associated protein-like [Salarias fasciatus]|uniref:Plasmalemma vesicle-associated protein-like n=1 Tax=Salarias fasciatus TaxID=181472 RepID=A0A672JSK2_SALFA|nr:plasmalemma vesicle-associated protein-like [Salarias fasciatus]XP_029939941.1 plasmalemma vesicle-associated protein-like [Salarias fasciatus]
MYSSSYSRAKFGLDAREPLHRSKGKSCGYYMRIIFFFSSLIQSLIIVSLVLFLIYGQPEKSAEEKRVKELELGFNQLSQNNIQLRKEKGELGAQLGARTAEKDALLKEMAKMKTDANTTEHEIKNKLLTCENSKAMIQRMMAQRSSTPVQSPSMVTTSSELKALQSLNAQQRAMITLINSNFSQMVQYLSLERDNALKDRDKVTEDAIYLRRENTIMKEQLTTYTKKCKEDFAHSLDGIQSVTRDFLNRINTLFPHQLTFHLTCDRQQEEMEKIRNSCTNLSRDVENKFQLYLDSVGNKVAEIQAQSSRLEVLNVHLSSEAKQCERRRSEAAAQAAKQLELMQKDHDDKVEKLLMEQNRLREQKKLQEDGLALREKEVHTLQAMLANLKPGPPKVPGVTGNPQQGR